GRLRTSFEFIEYHNDFSVWAHRALHDDVLAERIDIMSPIDYDDLEELRQELINRIEVRIEERESVPFSTQEDQFQFARAKIIIFDTNVIIQDPKDLPQIFPHLTMSTLFYHVIDASRRVPSKI